jgi:malate dehydrogenase
MAESYLKNQKKTLPCAAYLDGEYGVKDLYLGVPVVIGSNGIEKVEILELDSDERKYFDISLAAVKDLFEAAKKIDPSLS